jgi:hypothetical protein
MSSRARKILSALTLCALAPGAALAQAELMFGPCRKIPDDTARLKCFDAIVPAPQETDQPKDGVIGRPSLWKVEDFRCCASG